MPRLAIALAMAALLAAAASADTVLLGNGDRISGVLTGIVDARLHITTEYAGEISLSLDAIALVETDGPRALRLEDGQLLSGRLVSTGDAQRLLTDHAELPIDWERVTALAMDAPAIEALELARIEAAKEAADAREKRWSGTADAGMTWRSGQVDTIDANLKISATRAWDGRKLILTGEAGYGEADALVTVRRYFGQARYEQHLRERLFAYGMTHLEQDAARALDLRWGTAAGIGYDFIKRDKTTLSADIGLSYRIEWWKQLNISQERRARDAQRVAIFNETRAFLETLRTTPLLTTPGAAALMQYANRVQALRVENPVERNDGAELRLAARLAQDLFERGKLTNELVLLPDLDDWGELRAINELALSTPLSDTLALRISLKSEYESIRRRFLTTEWDHTLLMGLRYAF